MSKLILNFCLIIMILPVCGIAQTPDTVLSTPQQPLASPTQGSQQNAPLSAIGAPTFQIPQLRNDATTITDTPSVTQDLSDEQEELLRRRASSQPATALPPEPDIEFQEFVASSLGARLAIFGHNLFERVPSTFAPLDRVQVTPDYIVGPGDELVVRAWGQINVDVRRVVDRSGAIYIPKVGAFNVAGVRYEQLDTYLNGEIGRIFKNFQLSVTMGRLRSIDVFVVGQVRRPGTYTISSLSSLIDALFASGGPSKRGSMRNIQVKRDGKVVTTFDLYDLIVLGDKSKDVKLMPGDVIYVPPVGPLVALTGSVNIPGVFELKSKATLSEVVGYAGGLANTAAGEYSVVERIDSQHVRKVEEFPLDEAGWSRQLQDGDLVRFLHISPKFENAVTLRGNIAVPGRYPWRPGMRVHDLIPNRDFLITEEYWKKQNQLVLTATEGSAKPAQPAGRLESPGARIGQTELRNDVKRVSAEINWEYAVIQRLNPQDLSSHLLPFNLAKAIEGDAAQNLELQPSDIITIFSQADIQVPIAQQSKFVYLEGEFWRAGVYQVQAGETLRHLIQRVGGFTPQAYLYGAVFTRESTRAVQQKRLEEYVDTLDKSISRRSVSLASLGDPTDVAAARAQEESQRNLVERMRGLRASGRIVLELKHTPGAADVLPDLVLEDGDRLLVPFRPATVNVMGAVYNNGSFIYKPGKTVSDYLALAGGSTREGDAHREFVVRADGSTVSRQQFNTLLGGSFGSVRLMPGDTIIVPEKLDRGATLRALRDYSVILGQLGLAAGGIRTLFP